MLKKTIVLGMILLILFSQCDFLNQTDQPRLSLFIGVDISGSFIKGGHFDDSLIFLAHYIYAHLNGLDGLEKPANLFVGSIGGAAASEAKTFYPMQTFENRSVREIHDKLIEIFPAEDINPFTDYNAFFEQIAQTVRSRNLLMRPISIVMVSDGKPDINTNELADYQNIDMKPLERLARNVTVRLLYTTAKVGDAWQRQVTRQRVRVWTQDAKVMASWQDDKIYDPEQLIETQVKFLEWIKQNVDFPVRVQRVK